MGERVRSARDLAKMTQNALALAAGVQSQQIWRIEHQAIMPEADTLVLIARALKVSVNWLLWGEERMELDADAANGHTRVRRFVDAWAAKHGVRDEVVLERMRARAAGTVLDDETLALWRKQIEKEAEQGPDVIAPPPRQPGQRQVPAKQRKR